MLLLLTTFALLQGVESLGRVALIMLPVVVSFILAGILGNLTSLDLRDILPLAERGRIKVCRDLNSGRIIPVFWRINKPEVLVLTIFIQALELGREIAKTKEYNSMMTAEKAVKDDPGAFRAVKEYQDLQQLYYRMQMSGQQLTEEHLEKMKEAEGAAMSNGLVKDYYESRLQFHQIVEKVNARIQEGITGVNPDQNCAGG
ncbi:MAG: YlbF family regulator [Bacillota bacterium]